MDQKRAGEEKAAVTVLGEVKKKKKKTKWKFDEHHSYLICVGQFRYLIAWYREKNELTPSMFLVKL